MKALLGRIARSWGGWPVHLALAVMLFPRAVFLGETIFDRDVHLYWYPLALVFARTIRAGFLPLWNLTIGFGQPLLADSSAQVLYPTTWLGLLLPPWTLYTVFAIAHLVFSAVGFTRLARAAAIRQGAAVAAGAAWMLSGPMVSLVNLWHHFASAAWMPWVVLAAHRLARRPSLGSILGLGLCLGMQVLAGSGDMALLTAGLVAVWLVAAGPRPSRGRVARAAPAAVLGVLLAAALSAGQWLPTLDVASRALRRDMPDEARVSWSVPPAGLVRTLVPLDASGRVAYGNTAHMALFDSPRPPFLGSLYVGAVALALGVVAVADGRRRPLALGLAASAILASLVALGPHSPVYSLMVAAVPGAAHLRYPTKVMVVAGFAVAMLAGLGLSALRSRPRGRLPAAAAALAGALVLAGAAVLFGPALRSAIAWGLLLDREGVETDAFPTVVRLVDHALLAVLAAAALLKASSSVAWPRRLVAAGLVADLLLAHHDLHATAPPELLTARPPVLAGLDRADYGRVYVYEYSLVRGASPRLLGRPYPYAVAQPPAGIDPRPLGALAMRFYPVPPVGGSWGVEGSYEVDQLGLQPLPLYGLNLSLRLAEGTPAHARLLRLGAVRSVVALHRRGFEDLVPTAAFASLFPEPILTYRVPGSLPRAYSVGRAHVSDGQAALQALLDPSFDPTRQVVLAGEGAAAAAEAGRGGRGGVRIEELFADRERLDVDLDRAGYVISVDAWDPGWRAWVDGKASTVLRANVAFRAVAVPAGRHVVELAYRPWSVLVGVTVTAGALLTSIGLGGVLYRRRRRRLKPASTSSADGPGGSACAGGSRPASPRPARRRR